MNDFFALGLSGMMEFWADVPTIHTDSELTFYRDKQWTRAVAKNDLGDLWHLTGAIPYCDAVVTEHFWVAAARERQLDRKYRTLVASDLAALLPLLS